MTNETDLHAVNSVTSSGIGRSFVYCYAVLILSVPVILFGVTNPTLKLGILAMISCVAIAPPIYVLQKRRTLHALRQAQVTALRRSADD